MRGPLAKVRRVNSGGGPSSHALLRWFPGRVLRSMRHGIRVGGSRRGRMRLVVPSERVRLRLPVLVGGAWVRGRVIRRRVRGRMRRVRGRVWRGVRGREGRVEMRVVRTGANAGRCVAMVLRRVSARDRRGVAGGGSLRAMRGRGRMPCCVPRAVPCGRPRRGPRGCPCRDPCVRRRSVPTLHARRHAEVRAWITRRLIGGGPSHRVRRRVVRSAMRRMAGSVRVG